MASPQPLPPVPVEVLEQVLLYLPLKNLASIAFASKAYLAPFLLESYSFAKRHFHFQQTLSLPARMHSLDWDSSLPLTYKVAVYHAFIISNNEPLDNSGNASQDSGRSTLQMDEFDTIQTLEALITEDPAFVPLYINSILRQALLMKQSRVMDLLLTDSRFGFGRSGSLGLEDPWHMHRWASFEHHLIHREESKETLIVTLFATDVSPALLSLIQDSRVIISESSVSAACRDSFNTFMPWGFDFWDAIFKNACEYRGKYSVEMLRDACRIGSVQDVKLLLVSGHVDPSAEDNVSIKAAHSHENYEIIEILLRDSRIRLNMFQRIFFEYFTFATMLWVLQRFYFWYVVFKFGLHWDSVNYVQELMYFIGGSLLGFFMIGMFSGIFVQLLIQAIM
ncbi:hypothetical protein BDR26DRAFT_854178 [Obelidium mucronatum]|nr:hypothetical protein BDR26DRAFT_854178 [Obelidium mucronatum]